MGYMDENIYPAYYEDAEWKWRHNNLGLINYLMANESAPIHYRRTIRRSGGKDTKLPHDVLAFTGAMKHTIGDRSRPHQYFRSKTRAYSNANATPPIDAWVWDKKRWATIAATTYEYYAYLLGRPADAAIPPDFGWLPPERQKELKEGQEFHADMFTTDKYVDAATGKLRTITVGRVEEFKG